MEDWTELDEIQLDIYNRLKFHFGEMLLFFELRQLEEGLNSNSELLLPNISDRLNNNGFCSSLSSFHEIENEEALFLLEWKLTYTEFSTVVVMPSAQISYIYQKIKDTLGPIRIGFTNANIDQAHNEAHTNSILCTSPEIGVFQNMALVIVSEDKMLSLVTYCEY